MNFQSYPLPTPVNPVNGWMSWANVPSPGPGSVISIGGMWTNSAGVWSYVGGTLYTNTSGLGFTIGGVTYPYVITNRLENTNWVYYSASQLTQNIFVDAQYVVLYLPNGISLSGSDVFAVNTNADIQVWTAGRVTISGAARINNMYAPAFSLYDVAGNPNPVSVNFIGNTTVAGYLYVPSSFLIFSGGDFVGAVVCKNIVTSGGGDIHFDESLAGLLPPWTIQQPTNQIVPLGSDVTFSVNAGGSSLGYQWFFSQGNVSNSIPGAIGSSLILTNVQLTNAGNYSVVITNSSGTAISSPASLVIYTNAAATLSGMFNAAGGALQFNVSGVTGLDYTLEASTNLEDWIPLYTNASPFTFTETNPACPQRFYRAIFIP